MPAARLVTPKEKLFVTVTVVAGAIDCRVLLKICQVTWTGGFAEETVPLMLKVPLVNCALAAGLVIAMIAGTAFEMK